jgi:hypothetical protein
LEEWVRREQRATPELPERKAFRVQLVSRVHSAFKVLLDIKEFKAQ